ncbi:hypothetical protein O6H91_20G065200 [Diphasiastrum complanatum]|uniref:Uncharacterized protein n=1 Tax=Diphasiastrum complanatum TaxID=34168 RepID=A0ACC2ARA3_DIPCM|nr:hypothetical protein O6H91_20G065200 [Diphasiastrum complanatum]
MFWAKMLQLAIKDQDEKIGAGSGMAAYTGSTAITTEHIQKYLDENKQLILAILDNQNLGKLNECAQYQFKLQQNLMYLAAIADAQPQMSPAHSQVAPVTMLQPGGQQYLQQQQQLIQQSMLGQRNLQYLQQSSGALQQQQHLMSGQGQMGAAANSGILMLSTQSNMGGHNGPGGGGASVLFPDFGRSNASGENQQQTHIGLGAGGSRPGIEASSGNTAGSGDGSGSGMQAADDTEASYLKASEDGS